VSGYTAKVAGTEQGVTEPQATFSACFGGAFLVMHPYKYAALLAEKMVRRFRVGWPCAKPSVALYRPADMPRDLPAACALTRSCCSIVQHDSDRVDVRRDGGQWYRELTCLDDTHTCGR